MSKTNQNSEIIEEYRTLRSEIMNMQKQKSITPAFTIGAVATLIGVYENRIFSTGNGIEEYQCISIIMFALLLYFIIIPSVMMQIRTQIAIQRLSSYIREFIEKQVEGLNWETRFFERNKTVEKRARRKGIQSYGKFYLFLSFLPLFFAGIFSYQNAINVFSCPVILAFLFLLAIGGYCIYLSLDLWHAFSSQWDSAEWEGKK